jgi:hypothetical protein
VEMAKLVAWTVNAYRWRNSSHHSPGEGRRLRIVISVEESLWRMFVSKRDRRVGPEGSAIQDYVVEDHANHELGTFKTPKEAIDWAKAQGHAPPCRSRPALERQEEPRSLAVDVSSIATWQVAERPTKRARMDSRDSSPAGEPRGSMLAKFITCDWRNSWLWSGGFRPLPRCDSSDSVWIKSKMQTGWRAKFLGTRALSKQVFPSSCAGPSPV